MFFSIEAHNKNGDFMIQTLLSLMASLCHTHYFVYEPTHGVLFLSDSLVEEFHLHAQENGWDSWMKITYPEDLKSLQDFIHILPHQKHASLSIRCYSRGGKIIPLTFQTQRIQLQKQTCIAGTIVSGLRNHTDLISGLPDAFRCENTCNEYIDKPEIDQFLLGILDLDNFQSFNDAIGYTAGNQLLRKTADCFQSILPARAQLFRLQNDQFAVLCTVCSPTTLQGWVNVFNQLLITNEMPTVSCGFVSYPENGEEWPRLRKRAQFAMKQAKQDGKACSRPFTLPMEIRHHQSYQLETRLRQSIHDQMQGFYLMYQPQLTKDGRIKGMEALLRWNQEPCDTFIPILETSGLLFEITDWLFDQALHDFAGMRKDDPTLSISINLSYPQLIEGHISECIKAALYRYQIPGSSLIIEITETRIAENFLTVKPLLNKLRSMGIRIAMDDFGTGYASLSFLRQMPIDIIKIDRSFVVNLETHPADITFIRLIADIGKELGCTICLEGVETAGQLARLSDIPVDTIQGYYFSRPLILDAMRVFLRQQKDR